MANDPNRDLLPVKEENSCRGGKGLSERIDHQVLIKLPRCELEDKFLRLLDEQTQLKKLLNCQEEKIKRLGTKLLRLISEKKGGKKNSEHCKEIEELNFRIIELEHENYILKDKNVVLKQQLANHSCRITVQPSPVRSTHTSPLMSVRQTAGMQNEVVYDQVNKNSTAESQLHEAEMHIKELNEEIKSLHCKIDYLQQDLEKNCLDNRRTKVTENIELIRLQRSLKQQAIQIATLQAQVKNSENNQNILKQELAKAHIENDEALNMISLKQNEILTLYGKLEEKNLSRLEEDELRERINDLVKERDSLKERSDFLMKTIYIKSEEAEKAENFRKLLAEEKLKREQLENSLKKTQMVLKSLQNSTTSSGESAICCCDTVIRSGFQEPTRTASGDTDQATKQMSEPKNDDHFRSLNDELFESENSDEATGGFKMTLLTSHKSEIRKGSSADDTCCNDGNSQGSNKATRQRAADSDSDSGKTCADKMKLERELQYLREMLRSQTARCEAQQAEINRLMYELKVNEDKCNFTLKRLESYLNVFQNLERKTQPEIPFPKETHQEVNQSKENAEIQSQKQPPKLKEANIASPGVRLQGMKSDSTNLSVLLSGGSLHSNASKNMEPRRTNRSTEYHENKRFVDQTFLESSEDEDINDDKLEKVSYMKKYQVERLNSPGTSGQRNRGPFQSSPNRVSSRHLSESDSDLETSKRATTEPAGGNSLTSHRKWNPSSNTSHKDTIQIAVLYLQIDPSCEVWKNENIKLIFVDFSFLDVEGEETETPDSLCKPKNSEEKCEFNFYKNIAINEEKNKTLNLLFSKPDIDLIVFKVVSDPEKSSDDSECEEIGVAVVTVQEFISNCNNGPFAIPVQNMKSYKEVIGKLTISVNATEGVFS